VETSSLNPAQIPTSLLSSNAARLENRIRVAQNATGEKQKGELRKVSQQFEAIFIAQLLKVMRETIEESGLTEGGFGKSTYTELFDQEVSLSIARRGAFGISDLLYNSLVDKTSNSTEPAAGEAVPVNETSPGQAPASVGSTAGQEISDLHLPVQAPLSSAFGLRKDPFSGEVRFHKGLDLAAPEGTQIVAALPGTVVSAGYENGYGNTVLVQHPGGLQTRYGHLASLSVKAGDQVNEASVLGTVGNTGHSTGPHLHFEVIRLGKQVDPTMGFGSQLASLKQRSSFPRAGS
jgi:murein DD-endopeptidase MepM/ murein hydrolase activator NlpD